MPTAQIERELATLRSLASRGDFFAHLLIRTFDALRSSQSGGNTARFTSTANRADLSGLDNTGLDGTPEDKDIILLKDQTDATQNGLYVASDLEWTRVVDDAGVPVLGSGMLVVVREGDTLADTLWQCTSDDFVIGTDDIVFAQAGGTPDTGPAPDRTIVTKNNGAGSPLNKGRAVIILSDGTIYPPSGQDGNVAGHFFGVTVSDGPATTGQPMDVALSGEVELAMVAGLTVDEGQRVWLTTSSSGSDAGRGTNVQPVDHNIYFLGVTTDVSTYAADSNHFVKVRMSDARLDGLVGISSTDTPDFLGNKLLTSTPAITIEPGGSPGGENLRVDWLDVLSMQSRGDGSDVAGIGTDCYNIVIDGVTAMSLNASTPSGTRRTLTVGLISNPGTATLSVAEGAGFSSIAFTNLGDSVTLLRNAFSKWAIVGIFGAVPT